jgi:2-polyprenyl-3-methyl-5-hydroxy-6-metoxy-1,4-benzoquinol methylase
LNNYYKNYGLSQYLSPLTVKRYNELLDKFESYRKNNKILDLGCGLGFFLEEAKKRGWEVFGTEIGDIQAKTCIKKGIKIYNGIIDISDFDAEMFDVVTSIEVIEHINNPNIELNTINYILRKGGLAYITTPNFNSLLRFKLKSSYNVINYPEHLSYYTPNTLNKLFSNHGFKALKIQTTGISLTRFKTSSGKSSQKIISPKSDDERIRNKIDNRWYLSKIKKIINNTLTILGKGDTIKGFFIKN